MIVGGYSNAKGKIVTEDKAPILVYIRDIYSLNGYQWSKLYNSTPSITKGLAACKFITVSGTPYIASFANWPSTLYITNLSDG